jgi:putative intracellular protease/amidase
MDSTRRTLLGLGAAAPFFAVAACMQRAAAEPYRFGNSEKEALSIASEAHMDLMAYPGLNMLGAEKIAMVCYEGMTMLDLVGPQYFFSSLMGAQVLLVTQDPAMKPIMGDTGFAILPTATFDTCPADLDVLFVGGGTMGTVRAMEDEAFVDFIADRGSRAKHITSVCTGSLILGQAGLLKGKRATSHWATRHLLPEFGATEVNARVVQDGNVLTGAGVSAGLDFALALIGVLRGRPYAEALQLQGEYSPEPPFDAGTLETIDPALGTPMHEMFASALFAMKQASATRRK